MTIEWHGFLGPKDIFFRLGFSVGEYNIYIAQNDAQHNRVFLNLSHFL